MERLSVTSTTSIDVATHEQRATQRSSFEAAHGALLRNFATKKKDALGSTQTWLHFRSVSCYSRIITSLTIITFFFRVSPPPTPFFPRPPGVRANKYSHS